MKNIKTLLALLVASVAILAQGQTLNTNQATNAGFYSIMHPTWPPMPSAPPNVLLIKRSEGGWYVDDRFYAYPLWTEPTNLPAPQKYERPVVKEGYQRFTNSTGQFSDIKTSAPELMVYWRWIGKVDPSCTNGIDLKFTPAQTNFFKTNDPSNFEKMMDEFDNRPRGSGGGDISVSWYNVTFTPKECPTCPPWYSFDTNFQATLHHQRSVFGVAGTSSGTTFWSTNSVTDMVFTNGQDSLFFVYARFADTVAQSVGSDWDVFLAKLTGEWGTVPPTAILATNLGQIGDRYVKAVYSVAIRKSYDLGPSVDITKLQEFGPEHSDLLSFPPREPVIIPQAPSPTWPGVLRFGAMNLPNTPYNVDSSPDAFNQTWTSNSSFVTGDDGLGYVTITMDATQQFFRVWSPE